MNLEIKPLTKTKKGEFIIIHPLNTSKFIKTKITSSHFNKDNGELNIIVSYKVHNKFLELKLLPQNSTTFLDKNYKKYFIYKYNADTLYFICKQLMSDLKLYKNY